MKKSPLQEIIAAQKRGEARGITSICSANIFVLDAAFAHARANDAPLLIESTCNQVNQFGGYTGQTPVDFMETLGRLAIKHELPPELLIAGGDHLGPNPWRHEPAALAMQKSRALVRDYVQAGYTKIHLDTSMNCANDGQQPLATEIIAARAADLAQVAEATFREMGGTAGPPLYIIGTEVPAPGGVDDQEEGAPEVTTPQAAETTIAATRAAFEELSLHDAWQRVIGVVVQPGVEYGSESLFDYDPEEAAALSDTIRGYENLVFEAHSTDYQTRPALRSLVQDQFAILKVGPALTFASREAIFALAEIEEAWLGGGEGITLSHIRQVLDNAMLANPGYWQPYYPGDERQQFLARQFSLSDRIRYYWPVPDVQAALNQLLNNLSTAPIPLPLLSQYLPAQARAIRQGQLVNDPRKMIAYQITAVLDDYAYACDFLEK